MKGYDPWPFEKSAKLEDLLGALQASAKMGAEVGSGERIGLTVPEP